MSEYPHADQLDTSPSKISLELIFNQLISDYEDPRFGDEESVAKAKAVKEAMARKLNLDFEVDKSLSLQLKNLAMGDFAKDDPEDVAEIIKTYLDLVNNN